MEAGPPLADQDVPGADALAAELLDPESLTRRIAAVPRRALSLLVCHLSAPRWFADAGAGRLGVLPSHVLLKPALGLVFIAAVGADEEIRFRILGGRGGLPLRLPRGVEVDARHSELGEALAMALLAAVSLAALVLDHRDLRSAPLLDDPGRHRRCREVRSADVDRIASRRVEHPVERHLVAGLALHGRDADRLVRRDGELLAARFDDGSHVSALEWIADGSNRTKGWKIPFSQADCQPAAVSVP